MTTQTILRWVPQSGDLVELAARNRWDLPAGRYRLLKIRANPRAGIGETWRLEGLTSDAVQDMGGAMLCAAECSGALSPLDGETLAREAQELALRLHAPLTGRRAGPRVAQHDCSALDLFRATLQPGLAL